MNGETLQIICIAIGILAGVLGMYFGTSEENIYGYVVMILGILVCIFGIYLVSVELEYRNNITDVIERHLITNDKRNNNIIESNIKTEAEIPNKKINKIEILSNENTTIAKVDYVIDTIVPFVSITGRFRYTLDSHPKIIDNI